MSTQYILLPLQEFHADQELAFVQSPDGRSVMRQGHAPLVLLDKLANTVLIVPAQRLSFHLINLPKAPAAKLKIALEGILEDLLLDEPSSLALAIAPHAQEKNATWVAVYEKAWMTSVLEAFDIAGHKITRIIPQAFPSLTPHLEVQGTEDSPWLIRSDNNGVLSSPLQLASQMGADLSPDHIIYCPAQLATAVESYLAKQPTIRSLGQSILNSANTEWDLAQFDIKVGGSNPFIRKLKKAFDSFRLDSHWRFARWGLFLLLLSQLVGLNFVAWQEKKRLEAKKQESTVLLQKTFPEVKVVVNPNLQMNRQLDLLRQASSQLASSDMETLLSITGLILPEQIQPTAYQYQDKQLLIAGLPTETFVIQAMQAQAQQRGYELVQQGAQYALRVAKPKTSSSTVVQDANLSMAASKKVGVTPKGQP
jgi:general secretion pathway protein L